MNKTLLIVILGIVVVAGGIGYIIFSKQEVSHSAGDGHAEVLHHKTGDGHMDTEHSQSKGASAPHDDTGLAPHTN